MASFVERIETELKRVHFFSVGACPGCDACGLAPTTEDCPACDGEGSPEDGVLCDRCNGTGDVSIEATDEEVDAANESHFSWSPCDSCRSDLGGDRHPAHGIYADSMKEAQNPDSEITHFNVCTDCLFYHAYGTLPEEETDE